MKLNNYWRTKNLILDLISLFEKAKGNKALELKEANNGVYVKDLSCYVVNNVAELEKLKEVGDKKRQIAGKLRFIICQHVWI